MNNLTLLADTIVDPASGSVGADLSDALRCRLFRSWSVPSPWDATIDYN